MTAHNHIPKDRISPTEIEEPAAECGSKRRRPYPDAYELAHDLRHRAKGLAALVEMAAGHAEAFRDYDCGIGVAHLIKDVAEDAELLFECVRRENLIASGCLPDPIFVAIERHKMMYRQLDAACGRSDEAEARAEGRAVTDEDRLACEVAHQNETEALEALAKTAPTTKAGLRAAIDYIAKMDDASKAPVMPTFVETVAGCVLWDARA
jgi:hypothetical protein